MKINIKSNKKKTKKVAPCVNKKSTADQKKGQNTHKKVTNKMPTFLTPGGRALACKSDRTVVLTAAGPSLHHGRRA